MKKINILLAIFFFVFNCCSTKTNEDKKVHIDSVLKKTHDSILTYQERVESVVLKNDNLTIIGDSANLVKNIYSILIKFEPYISFDDYKVDTIYNGTISKIDYNSNPIAKEYKTMITQTYIEEKVNFAGHYCFARWRCGAPCNEFALVDVIDGKVYDGFIAPMGFDFRKNSRMLIENPPDSSNTYEGLCEYCHPRIWIFNEKTKKFFEKKIK